MDSSQFFEISFGSDLTPIREAACFAPFMDLNPLGAMAKA
jgi:hypothetical protein